jgi:hypothetical protein
MTTSTHPSQQREVIDLTVPRVHFAPDVNQEKVTHEEMIVDSTVVDYDDFERALKYPDVLELARERTNYVFQLQQRVDAFVPVDNPARPPRKAGLKALKTQRLLNFKDATIVGKLDFGRNRKEYERLMRVWLLTLRESGEDLSCLHEDLFYPRVSNVEDLFEEMYAEQYPYKEELGEKPRKPTVRQKLGELQVAIEKAWETKKEKDYTSVMKLLYYMQYGGEEEEEKEELQVGRQPEEESDDDEIEYVGFSITKGKEYFSDDGLSECERVEREREEEEKEFFPEEQVYEEVGGGEDEGVVENLPVPKEEKKKKKKKRVVQDDETASLASKASLGKRSAARKGVKNRRRVEPPKKKKKRVVRDDETCSLASKASLGKRKCSVK